MAKLVMEGPDKRHLSFDLDAKRITLGRDASNDIVLADSAVSRVHAEIAPARDGYVIRDLESTNGLFVNSEKTRQGNLRHGDRIRLGNLSLVFLEKDDGWIPAPKASAPFAEISLPMFHPQDHRETVAGKDQKLLAAFYRLNKVLAPDGHFKSVVKDALVAILEIVKADTAMVFLNRSEDGMMEPFLAVQGKDGIAFDRLEYSRTLMKKATDSGEAILTSNAMADERFGEAPSVMASNIHSAMCVPLRTQKQTFGVLQVDARSRHEGFRKEHLEILCSLGKELALYLENMKLRADLKSAQEKLRGMDKLRTKFVTALGYQIATPVTVIDQCCHLLNDVLGAASAGRQKEIVEVVRRHSERLKYIVRDLERMLSWDIISKRLKEAMVDFDMRDCVQETLEEINPLLQSKSQQVAWEKPENPVHLTAHRAALREVLANMLVNAYKFTPEGTKITVRLREDEAGVHVMVEDNGIGLSQEIRDHIFECFFVGDENLAFAQNSPRYLSRSLGLGLHLSRRIVQEHGGKMWVESELGKFARFCFTLPKAQERRVS